MFGCFNKSSTTCYIFRVSTNNFYSYFMFFLSDGLDTTFLMYFVYLTIEFFLNSYKSFRAFLSSVR
nr:MAG TPA: hypothetical protein [Caudoviricetes sp.]